MVKRCHLGRKGNGHDRIDTGLSQGMQTVGRRHQFLSGRRTDHNVRVGIEGNHDRAATVSTRVANDCVNELAMPPVHAIEHADGNRRRT